MQTGPDHHRPPAVPAGLRVRIAGAPDRTWTRYGRVSLGVSMANPHTDGRDFRDMVDFVNANPNFRSAIIHLSDTLHRWNENAADGTVLPDAADRSRRRGDDWLARNADAIAAFAIPVEVVRHDRWLAHPDYPVSLAETVDRYRTVPAFAAALDADVAEANARPARASAPPVVREQLARNSRDYFLDEIAAYRLLYRQFPGTAKMYPSRRLRCFGCDDGPPELRGQCFMHVRFQHRGSHRRRGGGGAGGPSG